MLATLGNKPCTPRFIAFFAVAEEGALLHANDSLATLTFDSRPHAVQTTPPPPISIRACDSCTSLAFRYAHA